MTFYACISLCLFAIQCIFYKFQNFVNKIIYEFSMTFHGHHILRSRIFSNKMDNIFSILKDILFESINQEFQDMLINDLIKTFHKPYHDNNDKHYAPLIQDDQNIEQYEELQVFLQPAFLSESDQINLILDIVNKKHRYRLLDHFIVRNQNMLPFQLISIPLNQF